MTSDTEPYYAVPPYEGPLRFKPPQGTLGVQNLSASTVRRIGRRHFLRSVGAAALVGGMGDRVRAQGQPLVAAMVGAQPPPDPNALVWTDAIRRGLAEEGWFDGLNVRIEARYTAGQPALSEAYATQLAALGPDVFQCGTVQNTRNARNAAPDTPIVFVAVPDPIGSGLVEAFNRPGGNMTGIAHFDPSVGSKLLELLLQIAPQVRTVGFIYNPDVGSESWILLRPHLWDAAALFGIEIFDVAVRSVEDVGPAIDGVAATPGSGLLVSTNNWSSSNRSHFIEAVNRNRLPAMWALTTDEGLISYVVDTTESFRLGALYVGRILSGVSPADLPVRSVSRYILTINLRVAAAQGLTVPASLLAVADRVVE